MKRVLISILLLTCCSMMAPAQELEGLNVNPENTKSKITGTAIRFGNIILLTACPLRLKTV